VYVIYTMDGRPVALDLARATGSFALAWVDGSTGAVQPVAEAVVGGRVVTLTPPGVAGRPWVAWLYRVGRPPA
jgi:hypothetical protein